LPDLHGQLGLRAVEGLDLRLLIHGEDERVLRGVQVEAEDSRLLGLELGVGAPAAPVLGLVGPQLACAEDAVHRRRREAARLRQVPHAPGGLALQRRAGRKVDHGEALRGSDARRPTRALLVGKPVEAPLEEAPLPLEDADLAEPALLADRSDGQPLRAAEDDLRPPRESLLGGAGARPHAQGLLFLRCQLDPPRRSHEQPPSVY